MPLGAIATVPPSLVGISMSGQLGTAIGVALHWLLVCALCALLWWAVAWVLAHRRGSHPPARLGSLLVPFALVALAGVCLGAETRAISMRAPLLAMLVPAIFPLFYYVFSDDRYAPRWARWLVIIYTFNEFGALIPPKAPDPQLERFVARAPEVFAALGVVGDVGAVTVVVLGILPQVYARYHASYAPVSRPVPMYAAWWRGVPLVLAGAVVLLITRLFDLPVSQPLTPIYLGARTAFFLLATLVPVGAAFVLARGARYDRDAVANRLMVSVPLTLSLSGIYLGCALLLLVFFPGLASVASAAYLPFVFLIALVLAAAFRPLRRRIREDVGRRFFRRMYEATQVLTAFPATLGPTNHLDTLSTQLVTSIEKALHPTAVALWLCPVPERFAVHGGALVAVPPPRASIAAEEAPLEAQRGEGGIRLYRQALAGPHEGSVSELILGAEECGILRGSPDGLTYERLAQALPSDGVSLILPIPAEGELVGAVTLGAPVRGPSYTADERALLVTLLDAIGPTLQALQWEQAQTARTRERERVEQELQTARRIQEALLPKSMPELEGWHLAAHYQPAREVGGDFYDVLTLPDGRLGLVLGDVTGKGMPAALVMATTRSMLRAAATPLAVSPGQALAHVNELLCPDLPASMFVTCFYAILDPVSGYLCFANAGQDPPCLRRREGIVHELYARGMPLGLMPGMSYEEREETLLPGESVLFYSDGIVEAHNPAREMFGFPRLQALLAGCSDGLAPIAVMLNAMTDFTGAAWEQEDDITLVALQRLHEEKDDA